MFVKIADSKDAEHISKIWVACFTDDQAYIDNYLKYCLPNTKTWILEVFRGEYSSCLSILPSYIEVNGIVYKGGYIYGVGTLPEHRGKSYSKILIDTAIEYGKKENLSYLIVKPANDGLYGLYNKYSFNKVIYKSSCKYNLLEKQELNLTGECIYPILYSDLEASELFELRNHHSSYFLWPKEILNYAILEAQNRNGICKKFRFKEALLYIIAYPDDKVSKCIKVLETNAENKDQIEYLINIIVKEYPEAVEIIFNKPVNSVHKKENLIEKSALFLLFDKSISSFIKRLHLSLPLE